MPDSANQKYSISIFPASGINCSWNTIKVGWDLAFIEFKEINKFALAYLEQHPNIVNEFISELILNVEPDKIDKNLKKIFNSLNMQMPERGSRYWNLEWRKWRYAILWTIKNNININKELLAAIAVVYANFGYPEDMNKFIYYLPSNEDLSLLNDFEAETRLIELFNNFLAEEKIKIDQGVFDLPFRGIEY